MHSSSRPAENNWLKLGLQQLFKKATRLSFKLRVVIRTVGD